MLVRNDDNHKKPSAQTTSHLSPSDVYSGNNFNEWINFAK